MNITDEDILNIMLMNEKNMSNSYSVAINEMSNKTLYKKIFDIFTDCKDMGREIYNLMYSKGYYTLTSETESKIEKSYTKYSKKVEDLTS